LDSSRLHSRYLRVVDAGRSLVPHSKGRRDERHGKGWLVYR